MSKLIIRNSNWDDALDCSQYLPTVLVLQHRLCGYDFILGELHFEINTRLIVNVWPLSYYAPSALKLFLLFHNCFFHKKLHRLWIKKALMWSSKATRKSSCVNARGIPPAMQQVLPMLFYLCCPPPASWTWPTPPGWIWPTPPAAGPDPPPGSWTWPTPPAGPDPPLPPWLTHPSPRLTHPSPPLTPPALWLTHPSPRWPTPPPSWPTPPPMADPPLPQLTNPSPRLTHPSPLLTPLPRGWPTPPPRLTPPADPPSPQLTPLPPCEQTNKVKL